MAYHLGQRMVRSLGYQLGNAGMSSSRADPPPPAVNQTSPASPQQEEGDDIKVTTQEGTQRSQASILIDLGLRHHLFHDAGGEACARIRSSGPSAVHAIASAGYREQLSHEYYRLTRRGANRSSVTNAIDTIAAAAKHDGPCEAVHLRVGRSAESIVLDLGTSDWSCVEISPSGWRISEGHSANFRRGGKATALPMPTEPEFSRIWRYLNVEERDRPLIAGWLLAALRPSGPYPILLFSGEQGSGKTGASRICKALTDPSMVPLRPPPPDIKDLLVAASASWVLALDNLSSAKAEISDALCRISTGGSLAGRTLFTDSEETLLEVQRPMILNGIEDLASRPDLAQRCVQIMIPLLTEVIPEEELMEGFNRDAGAIFAGLLDGVVLALRDHRIKRGNLPRMADFARWAAAGMPALGYSPETFLAAYRANQEHAIENGLETSPLASALRKLLRGQTEWSGGSSDLLDQLCKVASYSERQSTGWPRSAKGLVAGLRRLAPSLRHVGIQFSQGRDASSRFLTFTCRPSG